MSLSPKDGMADAMYFGYRERTRALLRHLILERGLNPSHPLVTAYDNHLYLTTAYAEYSRGLEQWNGVNLSALRLVCFRGVDLRFSYCDRVATSIYEEDLPAKCQGTDESYRYNGR